jgi:hypothetical protein
MVAEGKALLLAECAAIATAAMMELNAYCKETRIKTVEEKARLDKVAVTAVHCLSRLSATKATPLTIMNKKKPRLGSKRRPMP